MGNIIVLILALILWRWLGGLLGGLPLALFVLRAHQKADENPSDDTRILAIRWTAASYLVTFGLTSFGAIMLSLWAMTSGMPAWLALGVFGVLFVFFLLPDGIDALNHLIKGDAMPAAYNG